jgi:hypothetical protein
MNSLRLVSNDGSTLVIEADPSLYPFDWLLSLTAPSLSARTGVDPDAVRFAGDGIQHFFAALVAEWRGWPQEKIWASLDGALRLAATHDGLGHVAVRVTLRNFKPDGSDGWSAEATLQFDAGGLDELARAVTGFASS